MNQVEIKRRQMQTVSVILALITVAVIARLTGYNGASYTIAALEAFSVLWMVIGGNLSDVLGRMIRIRNSKGQYRNAEQLRKNTLIFQLVLGLAGSLFLLFGADWLARTVFRIQYSSFIIMLLAPALLFRTVSAVLTGCFQGEGSELPTAAAALLRQVLILALGLLFCRLFSAYGAKVSKLLVQQNFEAMYGGAGAALAVSVSELLVCILLLLYYRVNKKNADKTRREGMRAVDSFADSVRSLCAARGMQWLIGLLVILPVPLGLVFLQKRAAAEAAMAEAAVAEYGVYGAGYWVLCGCWTAFIMLSLIPVYGKTAVSLRKEEQRFARNMFQGGFHLAMVHAAFASVFLAAAANWLGAVIAPDQAKAAARMLQSGGFAVLFLTLSFYFGRLLLLSGGKLLVLCAVGAADVVYVIVVSVLLNAGNAGVMALVYGGLLGLGVLCVLLGVFACRQFRARPDWLQTLAIPAGAAAVTGLVAMLLGRVLAPHLGEAFTLLILLLLGFALYWILLLLLRNFREQEIENVPGGKLIRLLGQMLRVF